MGLNSVSGNSNGQSVSGSLWLDYEKQEWTHKARFQGYNAEFDDKVTANSIQIDAESFHDISERSYKFGSGRYQNDKLSGYDYQGAISFGFGRHFLTQENSDLDFDLSLGYRKSALDDAGGDFNEFIYRVRVLFSNDFSESTSLKSWVLMEEGDNATYVEGEIRLKTAITDALALVASYKRRRNSNLPSDDSTLTGYTSVSFSYEI